MRERSCITFGPYIYIYIYISIHTYTHTHTHTHTHMLYIHIVHHLWVNGVKRVTGRMPEWRKGRRNQMQYRHLYVCMYVCVCVYRDVCQNLGKGDAIRCITCIHTHTHTHTHTHVHTHTLLDVVWAPAYVGTAGDHPGSCRGD